MNREIKFRAWNEQEKQMYVPIITENGKSAEVWYGYEIQGDTDDELMQYTGLKDESGKEIYEGDIVEFKANYTIKPNGFIVGFFSYDEETASFVIKSNQHEYIIGEDTEGFNIYSHVIGNIYENPELLTNN